MDPRILTLGMVVSAIVAAGLLAAGRRVWRRTQHERYDLW